MPEILDTLEDELLPYEPIRRLNNDMRQAATTMSDAEVRYLIDLYYAIQEMRKRSDNQIRAARQDHEPNSLFTYLAAQVESFEGVCNSALQVVSRRTRTGRWCMSLKGVSGVLTAGLLANFDVRKAPTAASFWRFSGLDPTFVWLGKEKAAQLYTELRQVSGRASRPQDLLDPAARRVFCSADSLLARVERQTRPRTAREPVRSLEEVRADLTRAQLVKALATRPWNATCKTLQWKLMDCLVKVQNRDGAPYYCRIYQERKRKEWQANFEGKFAQACTEAMTRNLTPLQRPWYSGGYSAEALKAQWLEGKSPSTWDLLMDEERQLAGTPMLPPGRIELRARRIAVKQFLADLHFCLFEEQHGRPPEPNAEQRARGKTSFRPPPGWRDTA